MAGSTVITWVCALGLLLAPAAVAFDPTPALPTEYDVAAPPELPRRAYLDQLAPSPRIQDQRRIRLRYERPIAVGKTQMLLRVKASPKPRRLLGVEVRF
jgi:hypothetical protein